MTRRFVKKPVVINAIKFDSDLTHESLLKWSECSVEKSPFSFNKGCVYIHTLEGDMCALPGDWIIRGIKGEFYPCKPEIFQQTYEEVK